MDNIQEGDFFLLMFLLPLTGIVPVLLLALVNILL